MKTRLIIVRHGESEANIQHRFAGVFDAPLTELGRRQAKAAADALKHVRIDAAYASDLSRAWETGEIVAAPHGLSLTADKDLREIFGGEWEGIHFREMAMLYPIEWNLWMNDMASCRCPGGESIRELGARALHACRRIAEKESGKAVLIATHSTWIKTLLPLWQGLPFEAVNDAAWVQNASITIVDYENGCWTPVILGDARHLEGL